jgi:hypothetical protein
MRGWVANTIAFLRTNVRFVPQIPTKLALDTGRLLTSAPFMWRDWETVPPHQEQSFNQMVDIQKEPTYIQPHG